MNASGVFQARIDGRWVDVASEVDLNAFPVDIWLEARAPERDPPADFEMVDGWHPLSEGASVPGGPPYPAGHLLQGRISMGEHSNSWLHAHEILERAGPYLADLQKSLEARAGTPDHDWIAGNLSRMRNFFAETARLVAQHGEVRLVFGVTY